MSEMIERVARAMWQGEWDRAKANERAANTAAGRDVYVCYVPKWDDCDLIFLGYARAAIGATYECISVHSSAPAIFAEFDSALSDGGG